MLRNSYGRQIDDLDIVKAHCAARDIAEQSGTRSYSVVSEDHAPICGYMSDDCKVPVVVIATQWSNHA